MVSVRECFKQRELLSARVIISARSSGSKAQHAYRSMANSLWSVCSGPNAFGTSQLLVRTDSLLPERSALRASRDGVLQSRAVQQPCMSCAASSHVYQVIRMH